jgi:hypothetical protein
MITLSVLLVVLVSACSNSPEGAKSTDIPTPSAEVAKYMGVTQTTDQLLAALQRVDSNWADVSATDKVDVTAFSNSKCLIHVYDTFQDAVDNDFGSYGDNWTYTGSYGQLGLLLIGSIDECRSSLPEDVWFPDYSDAVTSNSDVLLATEDNILDCLTRHAECLRAEDKSLPNPGVVSSLESLEQLLILDENGFCDQSVGETVTAQLSGCELTEEKAGSDPEIINSSGLWVTESRGVRDILLSAASTSPRLGKYMIYGEGWVLLVNGSTEKQKSLFIEMNKLVKGKLVARY